jgi:hypothetical protein
MAASKDDFPSFPFSFLHAQSSDMTKLNKSFKFQCKPNSSASIAYPKDETKLNNPQRRLRLDIDVLFLPQIFLGESQSFYLFSSKPSRDHHAHKFCLYLLYHYSQRNNTLPNPSDTDMASPVSATECVKVVSNLTHAASDRDRLLSQLEHISRRLNHLATITENYILHDDDLSAWNNALDDFCGTAKKFQEELQVPQQQRPGRGMGIIERLRFVSFRKQAQSEVKGFKEKLDEMEKLHKS